MAVNNNKKMLEDDSWYILDAGGRRDMPEHRFSSRLLS